MNLFPRFTESSVYFSIPCSFAQTFAKSSVPNVFGRFARIFGCNALYPQRLVGIPNALFLLVCIFTILRVGYATYLKSL